MEKYIDVIQKRKVSSVRRVTYKRSRQVYKIQRDGTEDARVIIRQLRKERRRSEGKGQSKLPPRKLLFGKCGSWQKRKNYFK